MLPGSAEAEAEAIIANMAKHNPTTENFNAVFLVNDIRISLS
jgi:hypothetical protein